MALATGSYFVRFNIRAYRQSDWKTLQSWMMMNQVIWLTDRQGKLLASSESSG